MTRGTGISICGAAVFLGQRPQKALSKLRSGGPGMMAQAGLATCRIAAEAPENKKGPEGPFVTKPLPTLGILERAMGFEPTTLTLARLCSTPELHPHPYRDQHLGAVSMSAYMPNHLPDCNPHFGSICNLMAGCG